MQIGGAPSAASTTVTPKQALRRVLKTSTDRHAFKVLCEDGCEHDWLAHLILRLPHDDKLRNRTVYVNRAECRVLDKRLSALAREFDDPQVRQWCSIDYSASVAADVDKPITFVTNLPVDYFKDHFKPSPQVEFDVNILCGQLRAAAKYFRRLGKTQRRVGFFCVEDFDLQRLLRYVREQTGKAHNKEVSILCKAATGRHSANALKQRAYRTRGGQQARRSAEHRQTT